MVIMFTVFVLGWAPWVVVYVVSYYLEVAALPTYVTFVWFQLALLLQVADLFLYNHKIRKYLTGLLLPSCLT